MWRRLSARNGDDPAGANGEDDADGEQGEHARHERHRVHAAPAVALSAGIRRGMITGCSRVRARDVNHRGLTAMVPALADHHGSVVGAAAAEHVHAD